MTRRVIFSMAELLGKIEDILEPYLGPAAATADNRHFVIASLEYFCYGMAIQPDGDLGYFLPTEVIQRIQKEALEVMSRSIHAGFGFVWPACRYGFTVLQDDVVIEETPVILEKRYTPNASPAGFIVDDDYGDFIPERLR